MKRRFLSALALIAVVVLTACGNASENKSGDNKPSTTADSGEHAGHDHAKSPEPAATTPAAAVINDDMLDAIWQQYAKLTTALVDNNVTDAKVAANAIEAGAKELKGAEAISGAATKIRTATDIDAQRTAYSTLSNSLISLLKKAGMKSGELYVDFCPMALNDKGGFWISNNKAIKNPYFGASMLTCGEVKETLQ